MASGFSYRDGDIRTNKPVKTLQNGWVEPTGGISLFEDFIGIDVTLADNHNVTITQQGTPTTVAGISATAGTPAGHGGWLAGSVDNVDAEIDLVALGVLPWMLTSQGVSVGEVGFVIPTALTARQYFFGLSDAVTEATATNGPLNIQSAYTLVDVATDAAGFIFSSLATAPTVWKYASTNAGTGSTVSASTETITGVVDDYTRLRVEVDAAGNAYYYSLIVGSGSGRGREMNYVGMKAAAVATTSILVPIFSAAATATTAVEWELDYLFGATQSG